MVGSRHATIGHAGWAAMRASRDQRLRLSTKRSIDAPQTKNLESTVHWIQE
jgi:hypothetical protein